MTEDTQQWVTPMNGYIYYHVFANSDRTKLWLDEQIGLLIHSKLIIPGWVDYQLNIHIQPTATYDANKIVKYIQENWPDLFEDGFHKIIVNEVDPVNKNRYEGHTLKAIYDKCQSLKNKKHILYMHTKGTSRPFLDEYQFPEITRRDWRHMMQYFCIEHWRKCRRRLLIHDDCDAVSCRWKVRPVPHFSGNFWWSHSDHIKKLQDPLDSRRYTNKLKRLSCEFWISNNTYDGKGKITNTPIKYIDLHQPSISHMNKPYPRSKYEYPSSRFD